MPTFQFADWPIALSTDLRILKRQDDETREFRLVYSISMDAYTQVRLEHIERLKAEGVLEVTSINED
jgi:hypothetical protein